MYITTWSVYCTCVYDNVHVWSCMYIYGHVCTYMVMYVHIWSCMYIYGHVCTYMVMYVHIWSCTAHIPFCSHVFVPCLLLE